MICKDVISIGGGSCDGSNIIHQQQPHTNMTSSTISNSSGHNTLQNRRKSQLITFSASSCDIKNSLSHEIILVNNGGHSKSNSQSSNPNSTGNGNVRLSFAEEDIMIITNGVSGGSASVSGSGSGSGSAPESGDLDDDVFRRRSLEVDEEEGLFDVDEYETHIEISNNANDDSGGGSYEDSHALHSSIAGSNRNSLEKDDDVDVISTDVSCYDQLLGSSCNTRNDDDDIATLVGDNENYTKLCKASVVVSSVKTTLNGSNSNGIGNGSIGGVGENSGIIYANPFMDDEGIAESGM